MVSVALCFLDSVGVIESVIRLAHMYALLLESAPDNVTKIPTTTGPLIGESKNKMYVLYNNACHYVLPFLSCYFVYMKYLRKFDLLSS